MSRATLMLPVMLLIVLLAGCAAREPRCGTRLRPINIAASAPTIASPRRAAHE